MRSKLGRTMDVSRHVLVAAGAAVALAAGFWTEPHAGAEQARVASQASPTEADPQSVSADARRTAREFWAKLPADKSAALERELERLEQRARRGEAVDSQLSKLRARHPELSQTAAALQSTRFVAAGPSTSAFVCTGMSWIGRNGRVRCIGSFKSGG